MFFKQWLEALADAPDDAQLDKIKEEVWTALIEMVRRPDRSMRQNSHDLSQVTLKRYEGDEVSVSVQLNCGFMNNVLLSRHVNYNPKGFVCEGRANVDNGSMKLNVYLDSEMEEEGDLEGIKKPLMSTLSFLLDHELYHNQRWVRSDHDLRGATGMFGGVSKNPIRVIDYPRKLPREWDANIYAIVRMYQRMTEEERESLGSYDDLMRRIPLNAVRRSYMSSRKWKDRVISRLNREGVVIR